MNLLDLMVRIGARDEASDKVRSVSSGIRSGLGSAAKAGVAAIGAGIAAVGSGAVAMGKSALQAYSTYEQMVGGVDKLYGSASARLQAYASQAYQTSGMSANQYMQQATTFSAALINSLGGDTARAADMADVAMRAMSDNVNVFGSNAEDVQNAIMGISRQNFTMVDNLKLGYAGTKQGMEQLIADANAWGAANGEASDLSIDSFADCVQAIQQIQEKQGIAGTTAKEAAGTIEGSWNMAKAAWQDYLTGIANPDADMGKLTQNLLTSIGNVAKNVGPRVVDIGRAMVQQLPAVMSGMQQTLEPIFSDALAGAWNAAGAVLSGLGIKLPPVDGSQVTDAIDAIVDSVRAGADAMGPLVQGIADGIGGMAKAIAGDASPKDAAEGFESLARSMKGVNEVLGAGIAGGLKAVGSALRVVKDAATGPLAPALVGIASAFGAMKAASAAATAVKAVAGGLTAIKNVVTMTKSIQGVGAILASLAGGPIPLVIMAVAALAAGLVYLWTTNEGFRNAVTSAWNAIMQVVSTVAGAIAGFFTQTIPGAFAQAAAFLSQLPATIGGFLAQLPGIVGGALAALPGQILYWLVFAVTYVALWAAQMGQAAASAGAQFIQWLGTQLVQLPGRVWGWLSSTVQRVLAWVPQMAAAAANAGTQFLSRVGSTLTQLPGRVWGYLASTVSRASAFAGQLAAQGARAAADFGSRLVSGLESIPGRMASIGGRIVDGIVGGIKSGVGRVADAARSIANSAVSAAKSALGIKSPSRVFRSIGGFVSQGLALGIGDGEGAVRSAVTALATATESSYAPRVAGSATVGVAPTQGASGCYDGLVRWLDDNLGEIIAAYAPTATPREFGRMVRRYA